MASKDRDVVDSQRLRVHSIGFDDIKAVAINREGIERIAGQSEETKAVSLARSNGDDAEGRSRSPLEASKTVDQCRVSNTRNGYSRGRVMVPLKTSVYDPTLLIKLQTNQSAIVMIVESIKHN